MERLTFKCGVVAHESKKAIATTLHRAKDNSFRVISDCVFEPQAIAEQHSLFVHRCYDSLTGKK